MRVVIAMSGGVDSSVAALRLKEKGFEVIGITVKTWPKEDCGAEGEKLCCSLEAIQYARSVAEELDIPYYVLDLSGEFEREVKDYFSAEYARGRTPNPCIYCNSRIKFGSLLKKARALGAEKITTGHYARIKKEGGSFKLLEAKDKLQDQSYFLYDIPRQALQFIEFPIGDLTKKEVREVASRYNFMSARRKSSQDICFVTEKGGYREYLEKSAKKAFPHGDILNAAGDVIGRHRGIASYTVGQRRGIGLAMPEPVYVLKIDPGNNTITVGGKDCAMKKKIKVADINWITAPGASGPVRFDVRIRYNSRKVGATVMPHEERNATVEFDEQQFAPTPGQAAVFYDGEEVLGGGWIEEVL